MAAAIGLAVGAILALMLGDTAGGSARRDAEGLRERERAEGDREVARLGRQLTELQARSKEQSEVFQILPDLVRQMFAATGRRGMYPVVVKLVVRLFQPDQAAVFIARPGDRRLRLADGHGLPASLDKSFEIDYGQGRPGHVAENRMPMDEADFSNVTNITRRQLEATAIRELKADAVAPIIHEDELLGVLCVGGVHARNGQEKRLLKMVADLAAVAFTYATHLKTSQNDANVDGLTGTFNKRYLQNRLGDEISKAQKDNVPLSLFILDIDHFKNYNDTNGHLEGDDVLKRIGHLLKGAVREDDVVARYGGEEFVVLFPGATKAVGYKQAQSIRRAVESHPFRHAGRQPGGAVTISGGVASFPEDGQSAVELLRAADQALYEAKAAGRNRIMNATPNYLT